MRSKPTEKVEKCRVTDGPMASTSEIGNNGAFFLHYRGVELKCIASNGSGWEHVSVSVQGRLPTWEEMSWVKSQFWNDEECVVEFHPPRSSYVNFHRGVLHLWKPIGVKLPQPPTVLVGPSTPFREPERSILGDKK